MTRITKTITFSLPPQMAQKVQEIMKKEGRTMSELVREALRTYCWQPAKVGHFC